MAKAKLKTISIAIFDISSSSVSGAHALITKSIDKTNNAVSILASNKRVSILKEDLNIERFVEETISQLRNTISTLKKADNHKPEYIQVLLASPWFVSQTRSIYYKNDNDFICTKEFVDTLIKKEIDFILKNDMERFGTSNTEGLIIEKQISNIKLNGYDTTTPFGKKAKEIELFIVVTVSPKIIIDKFKEELNKEYHSQKIGFTTSPYASFVALRDFAIKDEDFMIVDIGEEITDVVFIKNNIFLYQHSFPIGTYSMQRSLAKSGVSNLTEGSSILESFNLGKLNPTTAEGVQKSLDSFSLSWQRAFQEMIESVDYHLQIPQMSFVTSDDNFDDFFCSIIKNDTFLKNFSQKNELISTPVSKTILNEHISSLDPNNIEDSIIIGTLFVSRLL